MKTKKGFNKEEVPYNHRDHALFVGFAPYEKPEIAVAVLVEHGGHGGATAAPIAKKIIKKQHTKQGLAYESDDVDTNEE